jgi:hypothetical protein
LTKQVRQLRQRGWLGGPLALGALVALFSLPLGNLGSSSASAAYYYYSGGGPVVLQLAPATATNVVGNTHTVTATVTQDGNPVTGVVVRFSVTGSVTTSGSCTTDGNGQCTFTYTGPQFPGADTISAFADLNNNGSRNTDEPTATATKTWVVPASTPGRATGGGLIGSGSGRVTFGFEAKSSGTTFSGNCTVVDHAGRKIKCLDVVAYAQSLNSATFFGHALDGGAPTTYKITVVDNGEPGTGADTFSITTASGYAASGTLSGGNIQVH